MRTLRVLDDTTFFRAIRMIQISGGRNAWPEPHFNACAQPSLHVHAFIVVIEFCLRAQNHQQEFFTGSIRESLPVRFHFDKLALVHQVNNRPQVSSVAGEAIRVPRENAAEPAFTDLSNHLVEDWAACGLLGRMCLPLYFHHLKPVPLGYLEHLLYLGIDGQSLLFVRFRAFTGV